jgi:hypothetical protein
MMQRAVWIFALCLACGGSGTRESGRAGGALAQGVVANVDGTAITLAEVQRLCDRGLTPKAALDRLVAEALLAGEAARRGFEAVDLVEQVGRQALVQALLEGDIEHEEPTPAEIDAAYANSGTRFRTPERRVATHLLAVMPKKPSPEAEATERAFISDAIQKLRAAGSDPAPMFEEFKQLHEVFPIQVEQLPPAPREGMFVPEFSEALFSLDKPGIVPTPVRTSFGWHAIWLREILPETHVAEAEARADLTREIQRSKRERRLEALLKQLEQRAGVTYAPKVRDLLAVLEY